MLRANTAVALILAALLTLAITAVLASVRALRHQERATHSERERREQLWQAYLEQARANRLSGLAGSRLRALAAISNAAAIRPSLELRNEAIACLSVLDVEVIRSPGDRVQNEIKFHDVAPDFQTYVRVLSSGRVEFRRLEDEQLLRSLSVEDVLGTNRIVTWARFSPGGEYFGLGFLDSAVLVWRVSDGHPVLAQNIRQPGSLIPPAFSPDGRGFAYFDPRLAPQGGLACLELNTGRTRSLTNVAPYVAVAVASQRPWVAVGMGRQVRLIDVESGKTQRTLDHPADVGRVEWSHDGRLAAVACVNGDVFLWNLPTGGFQVLTGHTEYVGTLVFSPDDHWLISAGNDRTTRLWDVRHGREVWRTQEGEGLRFRNDGRQIAFVRGTAGVGMWQLVSPTSVRAYPLRADNHEPNRAMDLSPDGRRLAALLPEGLQLWDLDHSDSEVFEPLSDIVPRQRFPSWTVTFHPSGQAVLLCFSGRLELWTIATNSAGRPIGIGAKRPIQLPNGVEPRQATLSADGRTVLVELANLQLTVVDLEGERDPVTLEGKGRISYASIAGSPTGAGRLALSPDGRWAAAGKDVGPRVGPTVWDTRTGQVLFSFDAGGTACFSPDGQWLAATSAGRFHLFRTEDWQLVYTRPQVEQRDTAGHVAWTSNPQRLVLSQNRRAVELIERGSGAQLASFLMPDGQSATGFRLSHDGDRLVVAAARGFLYSWDLANLQRELARWNLDWRFDQPALPSLSSVTEASGPAWLSPGRMTVLGLLLAISAAASAAWVLRWHRTAIRQFVRSEAVAQQRRRELEAARVELLHSQKMQALGTLAAGIAHDFNNLLSVIRMSNQLIRRQAPNDPEVREHNDCIEEAVQQGKHVVSSMLGYSRSAQAVAQPIDVDEVVEETVALLSKEFLSGITLTLELAGSLPRVQTGGGKLEQILLNLIVNAAEAMNGRGCLWLSTRLTAEPGNNLVLAPSSARHCIELSVADDGPGIAPEIRDRVFEPFFTTKHEGRRPGTGLGLSLVYNIAAQAGLGLSLETRAERGTRFRVLIPVPES